MLLSLGSAQLIICEMGDKILHMCRVFLFLKNMWQTSQGFKIIIQTDLAVYETK